MAALDELLRSGALQYVRTIIEGRDDVAFVVTDPGGDILWANRSHPQAHLRLTMSDYVGRNVAEFLHPDDRERFRVTHRQAVATGQTGSYSVRIVAPHGGYLTERIIKWAARGPDGKLIVITLGVPATAPRVPVNTAPTGIG